MSNIRKQLLTYFMPVVTAALIITLLCIAGYRLSTQVGTITNAVIVEHVGDLAEIFQRIDKECQIIGFEQEKNVIDFLTVKAFVGSEVGAMNLAYPSGWQGPYLKDNPTVQEKPYVVLVGKKGWYIAPGDGVVLANGKVLGKDILITAQSDIDALVNDSEGLQYNGQTMVRKFKDT